MTLVVGVRGVVETIAAPADLKLNRSKFVEIVFVRRRGKDLTAGLPPTVSGFTRVDSRSV